MNGELPLESAAGPHVYAVSELVRRLRETWEREFPYVFVEGEVSETKISQRGHLYFTLKDAESQLSCVMWAGQLRTLRFEPTPGLKVVCGGQPTLYSARGQAQVMVTRMQPSGLGELALAFEQLRKKLSAEGLFEPARKRPLPPHPTRIALITSPQGAAVRDLLTVLTRRNPHLHVVVFPTPVQGEDAPPRIVEAIGNANEMGAFDVLIVARGGGSLEDLWAFNDERVVRAIAASRIPTVSAVGHEVDTTLADFAADLRAPTPSAAAELVVPVLSDVLFGVQQLAHRLGRAVSAILERAEQKWARLANHPALRDPAYRVRQAEQRLDDLADRLARLAPRLVSDRRSRLEAAAGKLDALSPLGVLSRGYAIAFALPGRTILSDAAAVVLGSSIEVRLKRGSLEAEVKRRVEEEKR